MAGVRGPSIGRRILIVAGLAGGVLGVESCTDDGVGPAEPMPAVTAAGALAFQQVSSGDIHTCGVTAGSKAYCWGWNQQGQLGDGSRTERVRPTLVKGGLLFRQISAGQAHTCGITTDNKLYCWGDNFFGQLGDGTESAEPAKVPVAVAGSRRWRQVSAGNSHTCAIAMDDRAFCWGDNSLGEIGNGSSSSTPKLMPTAVSGGLLFRQVSTALFHTCAVTLDNRAYCWGGDQWGQIGDGASSSTCSTNSLPCRKAPTLVAGGYQWRNIDAGGGGSGGEDNPDPMHGGHTCGITTDDRAFCWGEGRLGQNGDGVLTIRKAPVAVAGGLKFRSISLGIEHVCAVTTGSKPYCWGANSLGQLGDGTTTRRTRPRAVAGNHLFRQVSAGGMFACATTSDKVAWCWGANDGNLGDGTFTNRLVSVRVIGPS
jgi:alpha-tubulin suppressor-like RCC1 family protein